MTEMKEIPHLDYAENLTDDKLFDEINELQYGIFRMLEDYCIDNDWGYGCYMDMVAHVRNLTACAWVAGRRNLKAKERVSPETKQTWKW